MTFCFLGCAGSKPESYPSRSMHNYQSKAEVLEESARMERLAAKIPEDYEQAGDAYVRQGNKMMAFLQYNKARMEKPENAGLRYKIGRLLLSQGHHEDAMKEFESILKTQSDFAMAYEGKGRVFLMKGELDQAQKDLASAIKLNAKLWQAHELMGICFTRKKQYDDAIREYNSATKINPRSSILYNNLGMAHYLKGDYESAVGAFANALRLESDGRSTIYNNLGISLCKLKRYNEAFEIFKKAGDEATANNNMGIFYLSERKYQEALQSFEKAFESRPSYYSKARENSERTRNALQRENKKVQPRDNEKL